jgi:hypothetical protein
MDLTRVREYESGSLYLVVLQNAQGSVFGRSSPTLERVSLALNGWPVNAAGQ